MKLAYLSIPLSNMPVTRTCMTMLDDACAGGVFEEALAQAAYFLEPGSPIAQTVRNAEIIDNIWESGSLSPQARPCPLEHATLATHPFWCYSIVVLFHTSWKCCCSRFTRNTIFPVAKMDFDLQ